MLVSRAWEVTVIGGAPARMQAVLDDRVEFRGATTTAAAVRALGGLSRVPLVHAHMTAGEAAAVLTKPLTQAKVLSTRHFAGRRGSSLRARLTAGLLGRGIDAEIAISHFVAASVEGRPRVILNGVRPEPQSGGSQTVLVMQRLECEKDTVTALRAFAQSGLAGTGWTLCIAGSGSQAVELEALAASLGLGASAVFLGFVPDPAALRARVGVLLATAPAEPFGLAVVEAMAAGVPVIAASGGAHPETLGETGFFFPPGDVAACAAMLVRVTGSPVLRQQAAQAVRARHQRFLTLESHIDALEGLYLEVTA